MKVCLACQGANPDEANFCLACGQPLATTSNDNSSSGDNPIGEVIDTTVDIASDVAGAFVDSACAVGSTALECTTTVLGAVAEGAGTVVSATGEVLGAIIGGIGDGL